MELIDELDDFAISKCLLPFFYKRLMNIMKYRLMKICVCSLLSLPIVWNANAEENNIHVTHYEATLGASRIIYSPSSAGAAMSVSNPQNFPVLIQSRVLDENKNKTNRFIVTPPLFRLEGNQSNRLTIIRTGGNFPGDRESLNWLCVKAIPPVKNGESKADSHKAELDVNVSLKSCIKLFIRPDDLPSPPDGYGNTIKWQFSNGKLRGKNNTPYYINIFSLSIEGNRTEKIDYIPPYSTHDFSFRKPVTNMRHVSWSVVGDFGEISKDYDADVR